MSDDFMDLVVRNIESWICENINIRITINHISEKSGYSKYHIQRAFKKITKKTIHNYIFEKKMELSKKDLDEGRLKISEISEKYGAGSQQSFSRMFKRKYGVSPLKYKKQKKFKV